MITLAKISNKLPRANKYLPWSLKEGEIVIVLGVAKEREFVDPRDGKNYFLPEDEKFITIRKKDGLEKQIVHKSSLKFLKR